MKKNMAVDTGCDLNEIDSSVLYYYFKSKRESITSGIGDEVQIVSCKAKGYGTVGIITEIIEKGNSTYYSVAEKSGAEAYLCDRLDLWKIPECYKKNNSCDNSKAEKGIVYAEFDNGDNSVITTGDAENIFSALVWAVRSLALENKEMRPEDYIDFVAEQSKKALDVNHKSFG